MRVALTCSNTSLRFCTSIILRCASINSAVASLPSAIARSLSSNCLFKRLASLSSSCETKKRRRYFETKRQIQRIEKNRAQWPKRESTIDDRGIGKHTPQCVIRTVLCGRAPCRVPRQLLRRGRGGGMKSSIFTNERTMHVPHRVCLAPYEFPNSRLI